MNKKYLLAFAAFAIGAVAARFVEPSRWLAPMLSQPPVMPVAKTASKPAAISEKAASLPPASPRAARLASRDNDAGESTEQVSLQRRPRQREAADLARLETSEINDEVQRLLHEPAPQGRILAHEQSEDGTTVDRATFPTGELKGESWQLPTGEHIQRAFYQSGQIEGLSWAQPDGTTIVVKLKPNGLTAAAREEFTNGEKIVTKYDDEGQIAEKWQIKSNGHRQRIL